MAQSLADPISLLLSCAYAFAEYPCPDATSALPAFVAHSLDAPEGTVVPTAHSFAEYSFVSTCPPVVVAHSFAAPFDAVVVTPVPPTAQAFAE